MNRRAKLAELRHSLARYGLPPDRAAVRLGHADADRVLGGGLKPGALHEVYATGWGGGGFAALLALRLAGSKPLFWVRPDYEALEYGQVAPQGLLELGGDPATLILVCPRTPADALTAAGDILACPHVGAVLLEVGANPKCLDLVASRRLAFAAGESGAGLVLLRPGAAEEPSAALTRWRAAAAPSRENDDDWGNPRFAVDLIRHRAGGLGRFLMEWNRDDACFHAPDSGSVVFAPVHRPGDPQARIA